jgi:outer membrane protein OmpA-like peptidoglycan-associated protein
MAVTAQARQVEDDQGTVVGGNFSPNALGDEYTRILQRLGAAPAAIFDAVTFGRDPVLLGRIGQCCLLVAGAGEPLSTELRSGDLIVRRALGEPGPGHVFAVVDGTLLRADELPQRGLRGEDHGEWLVQVAEPGRGLSSVSNVCRAALDAHRRVPFDQVILRPFGFERAQPIGDTAVEGRRAAWREASQPVLGTALAEAAPVPCESDLSAFGLDWRRQDIRRGRRPRPQMVGGRPLCPGEIDLVQSGPDGGTIDLLAWNFDIDGAYTKRQHEAALDRLISELRARLVGSGGAPPSATSYTIWLTGFASRTGEVAYNQALANERESAVEAYLRANLEKFGAVPEKPITPLITFDRNPGGFDPTAPIARESPHARSVRVIAVPTGTAPPRPRPFPQAAQIEFVLDDDNDTLVDERAPVATFLRFGLWDHAYFDTADAAHAAGDIRNGRAEADNFVGSDRRRFYIRVRDPAATAPRVTATWKTLQSDRTTDDDAPASQSITLTETRTGSHVYVSRAIMLVTDETDAKQDTHSGLPIPLAEANIRHRGQSNHRLRRARIDGFIFAEYRPSTGASVNLTLPVFQRSPNDERRRLKVRVINYGSHAAADYIAGQLAHANARWNQIGLAIDPQPTVDRPIPAGVLGADGLYAGAANNAPETAALTDLISVTPDNQLTVVFVPLKGANAYATVAERTTVALGDRYFIFIGTTLDLNDETLAHELAHVLFNRFDGATDRRFYTLNTAAPTNFGVPLPDPRVYRRIQNRHNPDPDNDPSNDNIVNWARRTRTGRLPIGGALDPPSATTGNKLTEAF